MMPRSTLLVLALAAGTVSAHAQSAGQWLLKAGVNRIEPQVSSGDLSAPSLPGSKIDVKSATSAILTATYFVTDRFSVEAYAGLPYEHDIVGDGAIQGVGKIGSAKQVAPTVFAQWRFLEPQSAARPYVGLGLTYAYFYGEKGSAALTALTNPGGDATRMSVDSAWGLSPQIGLTVKLSDRWALDASVIKTYLKTKATLSTGQTIDTKLDPLSTNLSLVYSF